ncbi:prokineticin receptor 2-like, partial [Orbicella faveolata]|uniref:prokineticin receptor 2-like n=1 Tax=Orbicella faveolata TaxID=48498 RepID=UPI0009E1D510
MYRPVSLCVVFLQLFSSDQIFAAGANISLETLDEVGKSTNETSSPEYCAATEGPSQLTTTIHVLTLLVSLVGNILLITAFVRMREPILVLVANMAASDLLVAVFLIPRLITREIIGSNAFLVHGNGGTFLCKMCTFFSDISLSVSTQSLVLISVERFLTIWCPILYKKLTVKRRRFLVVSTWIMAMALHSPYFYTFRLVAANPKNPDYQECQPRWDPAFDHQSAQLRYVIFLYVTVLLIPLLVISVLYTAIITTVRRDKMASYRSTKGAKRCKERNRNLQRMAIATVTAFLICWALFIVISFLKLFSPNTVPKCNNSFKVLDYVSRVLASSYCAVNPCICF